MTTTTVSAGAKGTPSLITLVANTVDTVTFAIDQGLVEVVAPPTNTADIWYTNDGSTPTVGGTNCYYVPAGSIDAREPAINDATGTPTIKLISSGTPQYRVQSGT